MRVPIKYVLLEPITDGPHETPTFTEYGIEFLSADGIQDGELVFDGERFISSEDHARFSKKARPQLNDVLVTKAASVGKVARVKESVEFNIWSPLAILRANPTKCLPEFLEYSLKADTTQQQILLAGNTSTQANLGMDRLAAIEIPLPSLEEQHQIAQRVILETIRIDNLIRKKTRFIELLKEKRMALITHAVTKGLNPDAPMKDSEIEWMGEVPAHWELVPLKRDLERLTSGSRGWAAYYSDDGDVFIRIGNLSRDSIELKLADICRVSPPFGAEGERTRVVAGDVLFSITAYLGSVAVVPGGFPDAYVSQHVALARMRGSRLRPEWVAFYVLSGAGQAYLNWRGYGGTKVQLSLEDIADFPIATPSFGEQGEILSGLKDTIEKLDKLSQKTQRSIELLRERRSTLVTAAVTGKIDLRDAA